ncbi:MAG TPA: hypothetical protein VMW16_05420 [Sedimentisphaerales bacterium]|nr:hypothetical protein [Sedimentisphaerales bacterium]
MKALMLPLVCVGVGAILATIILAAVEARRMEKGKPAIGKSTAGPEAEK